MKTWSRFISVSLGMAVLAFRLLNEAAASDGAAKPAETTSKRIRHPVALAVSDGGKSLLVANRRSGSLSVVDATTHQVIAEYDIGRGLADLAMLPGARYLLAVDQAANQLLLLDVRDRPIRVVERIEVSPDPVRVTVSADGSSVFLSSRWSRRLTFFSLAKRTTTESSPAPSKLSALDLPFCPQEVALVADGSKLIVADAFGGKLAVIDTKGRALDLIRSLPAHNIRGLAFAPGFVDS
jgi:YVTN family beta-propeller protein